MKNIRYWGNQQFQGVKSGRNGAKMLIIDNFTTAMIYSLQVEQNRYISSLHIYLDSVK